MAGSQESDRRVELTYCAYKADPTRQGGTIIGMRLLALLEAGG